MPKKCHWYPDKDKPGRKKGFPKTACGLDGSDVGGLITRFFRMDDRKNNCKTCVKIFKKEGKYI